MKYCTIDSIFIGYIYDEVKDMTIFNIEIENKNIEFGVSESLYVPHLFWMFGDITNPNDIDNIVKREISRNELTPKI